MVDPNDASVIDRTTVESGERNAHQLHYGKMEPELYEVLQKKGADDKVRVTIWLTAIDMDSILDQLATMYPEIRRDSGRPMDVDDPVLAEAIARDYRMLLASSHYKKEKNIANYLQEQGIEVTTYRYIPAVSVTLPKRLIFQIAERSDVSRIYLTGKPVQSILDSAIPTEWVPAVWARGIEGDGIRIAIV